MSADNINVDDAPEILSESSIDYINSSNTKTEVLETVVILVTTITLFLIFSIPYVKRFTGNIIGQNRYIEFISILFIGSVTGLCINKMIF